MGGTLTIHTLGGLNIQSEGQSLPFKTRKTEALLVYLACTERTHPRDVLAEMLYEHRPQSQALSNLRGVLTDLRKQVGDYVDITRDTAQIRAECDLWLDVTTFETQLDASGAHDVKALEAAVNLYQGDFLSGFHVDSDAFEDWARLERERLRLRVMDALDTLTTCYLHQGDYQAGIATATRLLGIDPLREETHRRLMDLLWRSGQRGKALAQYERGCQVLRDELAVDPAPETTALYARIKAGETPEKTETRIRGYDLRERIGAGAYGEVWRARQPVVDRDVAVKVIRPEYANHPDFVRRFETEAQVVARLEHPNIVPLYDYWREPSGAYLVMRLLPDNLHRRLQRGPLRVDDCMRVVEQMAAALTVAHRAGVIHRDLKPANILLDDAGNAYLSDFGIAKVLHLAAGAAKEGAVMGAPHYVSPEQVRSEPVTPCSDVYSFGILLYEMLTGSPPFAARLSPAELLHKQLHDLPPSVLDLRPDLPSALEAVLRRATAKEPGARFPDALSFAAAFRDAVGASVSSRVAVGAGAQSAGDLVVARNPYKGLRAFTEADVGDFYGRAALVDHLVARLAEDARFARFLAVVGPSGCGKSSVVRAGLLPALREGRLNGAQTWFTAVMLPGAHPFEEVEIALTRIAAAPDLNLLPLLRENERGLLRAVRKLLPDEATLLLVIDQFEELFTLVEDPADAQCFMQSLYAAATDPRSPLRVLIMLRADFYDRPLVRPDFSQLVRQRTEAIVPMTADELERAISLPAEGVGVSLEPGLAAALTAEVHEQPGALPMLQYALTELFDRRSDHVMTLEAYQAIGGVQGALARRADAVYHSLTPEQQHAARQLFLRLVTLGEGAEDTRRRALQSELLSAGGETMQAVIHAFERARLLTSDHDPVTRGPTLEVAHEALLREWDLMRAWLDESRNDIRLQRLLALAAREWQHQGRDISHLLRGSRLAQFVDWEYQTNVSLTHDEREFLQASVAEDERVRTLRRRSRNRVLAASIGVSLVLMVLVLIALQQRADARDERARAERSADTAQELALVNGSRAALATGDLDTAIALALAANRGQNPSAQAQHSLSAAAYTPGTVQVLEGFHPGGVGTVDFGPNGQRLLAAPYGGGVNLYDITTGEIIRVMQGHENRLYTAFFSPDGRYAVSAAGDQAVVVWDLDTGEIVRRFTGDAIESWFVVARFSPDGRTIISTNGRGQAAGRLIEWDIETGDIIRTFAEEAGGIPWFDFSPDGTLVATGSAGILTLWDLASGERVRVLGADGTGHKGPVTGIAFTSDGRQLLTGSYDRTMIRWDLDTGEIIQRFELPTPRGEGYDPPWMTVAFSADDSRIMANGINTPLMVWETATGRSLGTYDTDWHTLAPHPNNQTILTDIGMRLGWIDVEHGAELQSFPAAGGMVYDLSPDGQHVVARVDEPDNGLSRLVLYDVKTGDVLRHFDAVPIDEATAVVEFSPDGTYVLWPSVIESNRVIVWDTATGTPLQTLDLLVSSAREYFAFNPDGRTFWAALYLDSATTFVLVDLATGDVVRRFGGIHNQWINDLAVSSDGRRLLTAANDGTIGLWDIYNGRLIRQYRADAGVDFITFMPDKSAFVASAGDELVLLDIATGNERQRFIGHSSACCTSIAISSDGQFLASSNPDDTLVWDMQTGQAIRHYPGSVGWGNVHFGANDRSVFVPGADTIVRQYRLDSLDELLTWTHNNRHTRDLTCIEREQYQIAPLCDRAGNYPTSTPYLTAEPTATGSVPSPTKTRVGTATPTITPMPALVARAGSQRGEISVGQIQVWRYEGRAGETLTIRTNADQPANWTTRSDAASTPEGGGLDTRLGVIDPNGLLMTGGREAWPAIDDIEAGANTDSLIEGLELPLTGTYRILVTSTDFQTSGSYTLTIEAKPDESPPAGLAETTAE